MGTNKYIYKKLFDFFLQLFYLLKEYEYYRDIQNK